MYSPRMIIFTDGSINAETGATGSAAISLDKKTGKSEISQKAYDSGTNNTAELNGIRLGLKMCHHIKDDEPIMIVSDSKYSLQVMEKFVNYFNNNDHIKPEKVYKAEWKSISSGDPYANQDIIKDIHKKHLHRFNNVRYVHINSHLNPKKKSDVEKVIKKFKKQELIIDFKVAARLIKINNRVDVLAKEACS